MSGFFLSQQLPPNEMDVLSLNLLEWGMPEPCPFPKIVEAWGLGCSPLMFLLGVNWSGGIWCMQKTNRSAAVWRELSFMAPWREERWLSGCHLSASAEQPKISIPIFGACRDHLVSVRHIHLSRSTLFSNFGWFLLQPRAASNWPLVQHELRGEEHARFSATGGSSGTPRGWSARAAVNRKAEGKHAYSWHSWLWYFWMGWLMLVAFKTNGQNWGVNQQRWEQYKVMKQTGMGVFVNNRV